jgi:hypothetical protein
MFVRNMAACIFYPRDGGSRFRNDAAYLANHTAHVPEEYILKSIDLH